ncbi:hypothetical protein [Pseudoalteromonas sp. S16_S37]|uniref:hypothetical protein n=1 Tax=Pseudoalteromonas sp. S16_S37 TaxID=2720228 RepID=UPI001EEF12DC|nr:hypothetical protein [Pseudoalteromonas sp. S16_S37]
MPDGFYLFALSCRKVTNPGEMYVVPKGVEHCPKATPDTHFLMVEPASTAHTGSVESELTVAQDQQQWI